MEKIICGHICGSRHAHSPSLLKRKRFTLLVFIAFVIFFLPALSTSSEGPEADSKTTFIFIQTATGGSLSPVKGKTGEFTLELRGVSPDTVYLSDRPQRIAGAVPNRTFFKGFDFGKDNPPNAAVVLTEPASPEQDVLLVTLTEPRYDQKQRKLTYRAGLLGEYKGLGLKSFVSRKDAALPKAFKSVSLYIDDCPDSYVDCYGAYPGKTPGQSSCRVECGQAPGGKVGYCWQWLAISCQPCRDYISRCTQSGGPCDKKGDAWCNPHVCVTSQACM